MECHEFWNRFSVFALCVIALVLITWKKAKKGGKEVVTVAETDTWDGWWQTVDACWANLFHIVLSCNKREDSPRGIEKMYEQKDFNGLSKVFCDTLFDIPDDSIAQHYADWTTLRELCNNSAQARADGHFNKGKEVLPSGQA